MVEVIRIADRNVKPHKATTSPMFGERTVLTSSPWEFVALWLRRKQMSKALFYWQQARTFSYAATDMPIESAPLLHYYGFMNATKALLSAKGVLFDEHHGVRAHNMRAPSSKLTLSNEGVRLQNRGIAPALSHYLGELETSNTHSLEELLFNLPCIHRTYCLTYRKQKDLFVPLTDCQFVFDALTKSAYFSANLSQDHIGERYMRRLPPSLIEDVSIGNGRAIRSAGSFAIAKATLKSRVEFDLLADLQRGLRADINYIAVSQTLWYVKTVVAGPKRLSQSPLTSALLTGPKRLSRSPLTSTLLAMHRLSEICRYRPEELASFLSGQQNWLLIEFIRMSPMQFIDELAAELTGLQFMTPNVRPAT